MIYDNPDNEPTCKKSIITLKYKGKDYTFDFDWSDDYPQDSADYMWLEGNYSCDCNKKLFLRQYAGVNEISDDDIKCGNEIELISIKHV